MTVVCAFCGQPTSGFRRAQSVALTSSRRREPTEILWACVAHIPDLIATHAAYAAWLARMGERAVGAAPPLVSIDWRDP